MSALQRLQSVLLVGNNSAIPASDLNKASGRRCILGIVGLRHHRYEKFFEVDGSGVKVVAPYDKFNTYVAAPVDAVLRVLKGTLNGDTSSFGAEWARGTAKLVGEKRMHDGYIFAEIFKKLAVVIKRYKEV